MTAGKSGTHSNRLRHLHGERIKDEVYRQMFRLEEHRPGAEIGLALALLYAWQEGDSKPESSEQREWLKKISPICLQMIEVSLQSCTTVPPCVQ